MFFSASCLVCKVKNLPLSKLHHASYHKTDYKIILGVGKHSALNCLGFFFVNWDWPSTHLKHDFKSTFCRYNADSITVILIVLQPSTEGIWGFPGGPVVKNSYTVWETLVQSLVWEAPTCLGAVKPVCHSRWAHGQWLTKPARPCSAAREATTTRSPRMSSPCSPQPEKTHSQQQRPGTARNKAVPKILKAFSNSF